MKRYTSIAIRYLSQLVFIFCVSFCTNTIHSQTSKTIKGNVTDTMGIPIEMAVIYTKSSIDSSFFRFTNSNEKGGFTITIPARVLNITLYINRLGYKPVSHFLIADTLVNDLVFQLTPQLNSIKEVVVKAERARIVEQGDTMSYRLKDFRDSTEYSVEDILKKLPGIEISAEGRIKANGKEIKTVLLEGDDMFGRQYTIGTKNIRALSIEQVDVIKKYEDNPVLKGIKQSDDVVLNLKLSPDKKNIINGNCDTGLGAGTDEFKKAIHLNVFDITRRFKSILLSDNGNATQTLNSGELSAIYDDPLKEDDTKSAINAYPDLTTPPNIQNPGVPKDFIDNALNTFSTLRNVFKPNERLKIGLNVNFAYNKDQQQSAQYQSYLYDSSRYTIDIKSDLQVTKRVLDVEGNTQYTSPNQKTNFQLMTRYYSLINVFNQKTDNRKQILYNKFLNDNSNILINGLFSQKISSNSVFQVLIKSQSTQSLANTSFQNENFNIFSLNDSLLQLNQNINTPHSGFLLKGQYIKNWGKLIFQFETGYIKTSDLFNYKSTYTLLEDKINTNTFPINQTLTSHTYFNKALLKYYFSTSFAFKINIEQKRKNIVLDSGAINNNYALNGVNANAFFELEKVLAGRIVLAFNWSDRPSENLFFTIPYFKDAFSRYIPSITNINDFNQSLSINYSYKNALKNQFFYINTTIGWKQNLWRESFIFNSSFQETSPLYSEGNQKIIIYGNFSQFIPAIKTGFELKGGYSVYKTVFNIQNVNTPIKTLNYSINPTVRIAFRYFLKLNLSNDFNLAVNQNQLSENTNRFWSNRFSSEFLYNLENWQISLSINQFSSTNNTTSNASLLTSNLSLSRKIVLNKKESTLRVHLYNLNFAQNYATYFSDNILFFKNSIEAVAPFFILKYDFSF